MMDEIKEQKVTIPYGKQARGHEGKKAHWLKADLGLKACYLPSTAL